MNKLHQIISDLFSSGQANLVIGYEKGTGEKRRPALITNPEDIERLVFDDKCSHNLSVYLTKPEFKGTDNIVVFTSLLTMRSILRLAGESQFQGKNLKFVIHTTEENFEIIISIDALSNHAGKDKIYPSPEHEELLATIDKMSREERFAFWKDQFSSCIKCYACRAACPMCYCTRCTVEINQPQWISVPSTLQGNFEYHIMRVMHMAGRCVDCGSCESACPLNIPLNLITRRMIKDIEANIGPDIVSVDAKNVLNTFQPDDKENFIK
jgi:formate dehydrogenase (coenzyme F420) beta subunit